MFEVSVEGSFCATHRVMFADRTLEPMHGHDWRITAVWRGRRLDERGLLIDFDQAQKSLRALLDELNYTHLNDHPWLSGAPASSESVARMIFEKLDSVLGLADELLRSVRVTEAPGCSATYSRE